MTMRTTTTLIMNARELTQLMSVASFYLDAADLLPLTAAELATTVSTHTVKSPSDRRAHALSNLDKYSAHLASCAIRLATIHEMLAGSTEEAWQDAYPSKKRTLTPQDAIKGGFEILFRDLVCHAEIDPKGKERAPFRKSVVNSMTFKEVRDNLHARYGALTSSLNT